MARATLKIPTGADTFQAALEGLCRVNSVLMRQKRLPSLYGGTIRYEREKVGFEVWRTCVEVAKSGFGDCEDLAAYRVAELRHSGEDTNATPLVRKSASGYHALVTRGDGTTEDPSAKLGMNGPTKMSRMRMVQDIRSGAREVYTDDMDGVGDDGFDEVGSPRAYLGADPLPTTMDVTFEIERSPNGQWRGIVRVPLKSGNAMFFRGPSTPDKADAGAKGVSMAANMVKRYGDALIPPQAKMALAIARSATARKIAKRIFG